MLEYSMNTKQPTKHNLEPLSLKGGYRGSTESTHAKMPHCWKSRVMAHMDMHSESRLTPEPPLLIYTMEQDKESVTRPYKTSVHACEFYVRMQRGGETGGSYHPLENHKWLIIR